MGNHEELIVKNGLYAKLNKIQADILTWFEFGWLWFGVSE